MLKEELELIRVRVNMNPNNDVEFITNAREDIPKLLSEIDRLNKVITFLGKQVEKDKIFISNYLNKNKKKK